jgi:predicted transcriptional regulator
MTRITLSLPDDFASALKREARRRHTSVSAVAREALSERLGLGGEQEREVPFAAIVSDADPTHAAARMDEGLAEIADETLAGIFERRDRERRDGRRGR